MHQLAVSRLPCVKGRQVGVLQVEIQLTVLGTCCWLSPPFGGVGQVAGGRAGSGPALWGETSYRQEGWPQPTSRIFHCSHMWDQMSNNVCEHLSFTFLVVPLYCSRALLQYFVCLVLIVIIFFRLIIHRTRIKTSACIHHKSLATFGIVVHNANKVIEAPATFIRIFRRKSRP